MARATYIALGALALSAGYASSAWSATIIINQFLTNPSFESGTTGWTVTGSPGAGAYTVTSAQYTAGSDGLSGGRIVPDGTNAAIAPSPGISGSGSLAQTTSVQFQVGNTYVFDFWVGMPKTFPGGRPRSLASRP